MVADAGNRRLRRVVLPTFRVSEAGLVSVGSYDAAHIEVVYLGQSTAFWDVLGEESFCAVLEGRLETFRRAFRPVRCHTVRIDAADLRQLIDYYENYLSYRSLDVVVIGMNPSLASSVVPSGSSVSQAIAVLHPLLADFSAALGKRNTKLVLSWSYYGGDVAVGEARLYRILADSPRFPEEGIAATALSIRREIIPAVRDIPLQQYDSFADFVERERVPLAAPLFAIEDSHVSAAGMALLAQGTAAAIARALEPAPVSSKTPLRRF